jgi:hypothetical protein
MKKPDWVRTANEAQLCAMIANWLKSTGHCELYFEVGHGDGITDIVSKETDGRLWGIEAKMRFSPDLIRQAVMAKRYFHGLSVAIPAQPESCAEVICERLGLGLIHVMEDGDCRIGWIRGKDMEPPRLGGYLNDLIPRWERPRWEAHLFDEQKKASPGHPSPITWTPWKERKKAIAYFLEHGTGVGVRADVLAQAVKHVVPAASARQLVQWAKQGLLKGCCRTEKIGGRIYFLSCPKEF